uniref:Plastocyanin-like domain-containing protein n=1 Tax=Steinernema glaseri TaxID=37863 RepID=A0A1I7YCF6_9BILA
MHPTDMEAFRREKALINLTIVNFRANKIYLTMVPVESVGFVITAYDQDHPFSYAYWNDLRVDNYVHTG